MSKLLLLLLPFLLGARQTAETPLRRLDLME